MKDRKAAGGADGEITFTDIFSGIGAFRLGLEQACAGLGMAARCVGFSEIDAAAIRTYLRRFPGTPALGDVRALANSGRVPRCDVLLAGFPCPAFSSAGRRLGFDDERGLLFFALVHAIAAARPQAFVLENVKGLASHDRGSTLRTVLETLGALGYSVRHAILNSRNFGVPQNRPRVYIVGFNDGGRGFEFPKPTESTRRLIDVIESGPVHPRHYLTEKYVAGLRRHKARHESRGNGFGYRILDPRADVSGTLICGGMGRDRNLVVDPHIRELPVLPGRKSPVSGECIRRLTPLEWERLQGLPDLFTDGQADAHRYRQLGNAVTVPVIRAIARNVIEAMRTPEPAERKTEPPTIAEPEPGLLSVVDLFAGCGGFSAGLLQAGGFRVVAACEWDHEAAETFRLNHPGTGVVEGDITDGRTRRDIVAAVPGGHCDVVVGGVPCQCHSKSGRRDPRDPRAWLYVPFMDMVRALSPGAVVIENVPDILTSVHPDGSLVSHRIGALLRGMGYAVAYWILNAADFGVAQRRKRILIFGWRQGASPMPARTHDRHGRDGLPRWLTVRDAIADLEDEPEDAAWSHVLPEHGPEMRDRIRGTPIGGKASKSYNEGYVRNSPDRPSVTLRGGAWPIHYRHDRVITPREGARIQGFPDGFTFCGSKADVMLQVGNAVPPPLSKAVGLAVMGMLGLPGAARNPTGARERRPLHPDDGRSRKSQPLLSAVDARGIPPEPGLPSHAQVSPHAKP